MISHAYQCHIEHPYKPKCTCGAEDRFAEERAAGEGMFERYVPLEGVRIPRMLSWAELRALHQDLREARI